MPQEHAMTQSNSPETGEWKLVPVEPTEEMIEAGVGGGARIGQKIAMRSDYRAMLAVAPSPPSSEGEAAEAENARLRDALREIADLDGVSVSPDRDTLLGLCARHVMIARAALNTQTGRVDPAPSSSGPAPTATVNRR
jgi:hypothetical protein